MNKTFKKYMAASAIVMAGGIASAAHAADSVNVAFFLEWATPNQIAKVDKAYDDAMGVDVNWTDFSTGVQMTEAMLAGDIDIAYSQGLAPFVTAIQQGAPLKMVSVAVVYEANDCFVNDTLGITSANASELEGQTVAVPLNTMADFSFRKQMAALDVDISTMTIVDQAPADGAVSLADGSVAMACIFGGASAKAAGEVGTPIMSSDQKTDAGIGSFDVVSVTEKFATENPDLLRTFLQVTEEANQAWTGKTLQIKKVSADAGMDFETTKDQMAGFIFPTIAEQQSGYFGKDGIAVSAAESLGLVFKKPGSWNVDEKIAKVITGEYLE
ncbi:MAG: taurine ABC transporter substrate-binding protein [SAR116 cluster bacterium]|nr:MAG: taurine ABC transporter substrate-binding protein [SAR116 cluster bacterium]